MNQALKKLGDGNTAEIFLLSDNRVLKLFKPGYSRSTVESEYSNHKYVCGLMSNIPQVYEFYEDNGRYGYIMERVTGESLTSFMMNEATFDTSMELFVRLHKEWLTVRTDSLISYKDWMLNLLRSKDADRTTLETVNDLPDGDMLCHGDFHPFNIIITPEEQPYIIDFANICAAPAEYDIARTYVLLHEAAADIPLGEIYLEKIGVTYEHIRRYVDLLRLVRKAEMA